jgi:PKD repeat protein
MYKWGWVACLLIVFIICSSGCTFPGGGKGNASTSTRTIPATFDTPALPDQYVAPPVSTTRPGTVTSTPTVGVLPLIDAAARTTINGTGLAGNSSDSMSTNSTVVIPTAQFSSTVALGLAPLTVQFTDTSLNLPTSWSWDFGDNNFSSLQNPSHTYYSGGQYSIGFTAANDAGSNTLNATNYVSVYQQGFSAYPLSISPLSSVTFTDTGTGYPLPSAWYWDFGDGITSTQRNTTHQYVTAGTYDVHYRISGSAGIAWINQSALITVV